jgi:hypothetical protein
MFIKKKRIRNIRSYAGFLKEGEKVIIGIKNIERYKDVLAKIGFTSNLETGESVLPSVVFGPISSFNAEGKYIKHKDQPMETAYRTVEWHWSQWDGPYNRIEQSKLIDVPYKRYPRSFIDPPSVEFTIYKDKKNEVVLGGPIIEYSGNNELYLTHLVNLFLEIFGECQFLKDDLAEFVKAPLRRLNWRVLPPGPMPWDQLHKKIEPLIKVAPKGNQPVIEYRLETISDHKPDFTAIGEAGFNGYIILGFNSRKIFICESLYYGNATYIFNEQWETLSRKTKAEIIGKNLQKDRIIHRGEGWEDKINNWIS